MGRSRFAPGTRYLLHSQVYMVRLEIQGPSRSCPSEHPGTTTYTFRDFQHLPERYRAEAWRRYQLILPLRKLTPTERTCQILDVYAVLLRSNESPAQRMPRRRAAFGTSLERASAIEHARATIRITNSRTATPNGRSYRAKTRMKKRVQRCTKF